MYAVDIYGTLWLDVYRILTGHPSDIHYWLFIYTIYTLADVCAFWQMHVHMDMHYNNWYM